MSEAILELSAKSRSDVGKGASRRLRREQGLVPAIVYGGKEAPANICIPQNEMWKAIQHEVFFSSILTLDVDGKKQKVVIKDLQSHPSRELLLHADFLRIDEKQEMHMYVPLHFIGEETSPGVKARGIVNHAMTEIEIKCMPSKLPEAINVDVAALNIGDAVHISQLVMPEGVKLVHEIEDDAHDHLVYSISEPKAEEDLASDAPEAPETEVISEKTDNAEGDKAE